MKNGDPTTVETSHIAIVDDDRSVRHALQRLVKSLGFQATSFATADEFLRSPQFAHVSCLILDIQMPGLTGIDLQNILSAMGSPLPIVFITAHLNDEVRARALARGAIGYLEKPFDDQALIALIRKALRLS